MARSLGDAFINLRPAGASSFTRESQQIATAATRGITGNIQIDAQANTSQIATKIAAIKSLIAQTTRGANNFSVGLNDKSLIAKTAALQASLAALNGKTLNINANVSDAGLARLSASALAADASLEKLQNSLTNGNDVVDESRRSYGLFGTVMDALSHHVQLFGGALEGMLPEIFTSVSGWHLLLKKTYRSGRRDHRRVGTSGDCSIGVRAGVDRHIQIPVYAHVRHGHCVDGAERENLPSQQ